MTDEEYETRLRAAVRDAEASHAAAMVRLKEVDAHPMSQEYKSFQWMAMVAGGRVIGLVEALNLLTGEEYESMLQQPGI